MADQNAPMYPLDSARPLAESMVWRLQRTFYGDQGIEAWTRSRVPQSITTSPTIAYAFARIVFGFLRDMRAQLNSEHPVYIVELGAGSGRFAYRFLLAFSEFAKIAGQPFVYVMTDASPSVIQFWRDNPRLQPFVQSGVLDFAQFDVVQPTAFHPLNSAVNPIVVIGNYIFDSIPQDAFTIVNGKLFANLVTITASEKDLDLTAPDARVRIHIEFNPDTVPYAPEVEADPLVRDILQSYQERLDETTVLLPRAALACVRFLHDLSGGRALFLLSDFGDAREDELAGHGPPGFGASGGFWLPVNFHAIGEYARGLAGRARHPSGRNTILNSSMLLFGADSTETELAYCDTIDHHSPADISALARALTKDASALEFDTAVFLLRTLGWDPDYVGRVLQVLLAGMRTADDRLRSELLEGIHRTWANYYPIGETADLPFALGVLLFSLQRFEPALNFFEISLRDFGEDPQTTVNLAMTLYHLHRLPECLEWLDRTLALDPNNELATNMRADVLSDQAV